MSEIKIPFCRPYVSPKAIDKVAETINKGWLTTGKITEEVEEKIASYTGAKYCVLLTSCTAALHLSLEYLKRFKIGKNFSAYVPALTFAATATEVINSGGKVIFGDVEKDTMCLKPNTDKNFKVAIPVHLCGVKANTDYDYDTYVIEDSAHLIEKDQCKNNPNLVCYSFYATKNVTMGEGGAICTNDEQAYNWLKQARHHGISKGGWQRYHLLGKWKYDIDFVGWKYNPSDVLASILSANLDDIDKIHSERQCCIDLYNEELGYKNKGLHIYPILVMERDSFMEMMAEKGIQCSVHFQPLNNTNAFRTIGFEQDDLPNTSYLGERLVSLPLYPELTNEEIKFICQTIKETKLLLPSWGLDLSPTGTLKLDTMSGGN